MSRPEADWKRQQRRALDWLSAGLAGGLVVAFLALWSRTGGSSFAAIAALFAVWLAVYLSPVWQPVFYVLGAVLATVVVLGMAYFGHWDRLDEQVALALLALFVVAVTYLFVSEEPGL